MRSIVLLTLLLISICFWNSGAIAQTVYREINVQNGGTIKGTVRFGSHTSLIQKMEITKDQKVCGVSKYSPRLELGKTNGVKNTVVYLQSVSQGKKIQITPKLTLDQRKCVYFPHVLIAQVGTQLEIVNSDPILHNVHAYEVRGGETKSLFNIAQPIRGQRTAIPQTKLTKAGLIVATCDAGHPWMSASILVVDHPYYVLTDKNGNFTIDQIPPGHYQITMWHEGVAITEKEMEHEKVKKYYFEESYKLTKDIDVPANETVTVNFDFVLR